MPETSLPSRANSSRLSWEKRLLFVGIGTAILLGLTELAAHLAFWATTGRPFSPARLHRQQAALAEGEVATGQGDNALLALHPYLGYVYSPTADPSFAAFHGSGVNDLGFIDPQKSIHKRSPEKVIIGVTGGSVAFWFSALGLQELERELKKAPYFAGKELVFVRLALGGYKQPQQLMAFNYLTALGAEFDILLNIDGFNEIVLGPCENVPRGVNLFYPRSWDMLVSIAPDAQKRQLIGEISYVKAKRQNWAKTFSLAPFRYSATLQLTWLAVDRYLARQLNRSRLQLQHGKPAATLGFTAQGPRNTFGSPSEMNDQLVGLWKRCSIQLDRMCRANGVRYFHFLQPNQYVPDSKPMGAEEKRIAWDPNHGYAKCARTGYPLLLAAGEDLARQGVAFTDLTRIFADVEEPIYIDTACHFGLRGNEIMAQEVARRLIERFPKKE